MSSITMLAKDVAQQATARNKPLLLAQLCKAHGTQGGVISQYCDIMADNFDRFEMNFYDYSLCSLEFNTPKAFKKLADRCNYHGLKN